jgi:hypothetical protein
MTAYDWILVPVGIDLGQFTDQLAQAFLILPKIPRSHLPSPDPDCVESDPQLPYSLAVAREALDRDRPVALRKPPVADYSERGRPARDDRGELSRGIGRAAGDSHATGSLHGCRARRGGFRSS